MSRLYIRTKSDLRKGTGKRCNQKAYAEIRWGSRDDSHLAASSSVHWPKGAAKPKVSILVDSLVR